MQTLVRGPGRGLGRGGGPGSQPGRAGCRCGGGLEGPGSLSLEDAGGKGSRLRLERCAPAARSPGRGGDGAAHSPSDRERRAGRAVTGLGRAEPSRLSSKQRLRGRPAASSPRPALRSLAPPLHRRKWRRRRRARPTMPRVVTSSTLAPRGGAQGKLRRRSTMLGSPESSGPRAIASGSEALSVTPQGTEEGEGCQAARAHPPRLAPDHSPRPPAWPEGQACQLRLLLGLAQPPGTPAAGLTQQPAGGHAESVARPSLPVPAWEPSRCQQMSPERPGGITKG